VASHDGELSQTAQSLD